jgi:hypothetical protein
MLSSVVETQSLVIEVSAEQSLCIETLEQSILAGFPAETHLLRWAIVRNVSVLTDPSACCYDIETTIQFNNRYSAPLSL